MTKKEFLKLHSGYFGEEVDNINQVVMVRFSGAELFDYVSSLSEIYAKSQWNEAIEDAKEKTCELAVYANNIISTAVCQQLIAELEKLKK